MEKQPSTQNLTSNHIHFDLKMHILQHIFIDPLKVYYGAGSKNAVQ